MLTARLYKLLLRLYPRTFRNSYGNEMQETYEMMVGDAETKQDKRQVRRRALFDVFLGLLRERGIPIDLLSLVIGVGIMILWPFVYIVLFAIFSSVFEESLLENPAHGSPTLLGAMISHAFFIVGTGVSLLFLAAGLASLTPTGRALSSSYNDQGPGKVAGFKSRLPALIMILLGMLMLAPPIIDVLTSNNSPDANIGLGILFFTGPIVIMIGLFFLFFRQRRKRQIAIGLFVVLLFGFSNFVLPRLINDVAEEAAYDQVLWHYQGLYEGHGFAIRAPQGMKPHQSNQTSQPLVGADYMGYAFELDNKQGSYYLVQLRKNSQHTGDKACYGTHEGLSDPQVTSCMLIEQTERYSVYLSDSNVDQEFMFVEYDDSVVRISSQDLGSDQDVTSLAAMLDTLSLSQARQQFLANY